MSMPLLVSSPRPSLHPPLELHFRHRMTGLDSFSRAIFLKRDGFSISASANHFDEESSLQRVPNRLSSSVLRFAAPAIFFLVGLGAASAPLSRACNAISPTSQTSSLVTQSENEVKDSSGLMNKEEEVEDEDWKKEFERWKSKTYALTVPLRIVALRGSFPPSWIKDFIQVQGKRMKLIPEFRSDLDSIFSDLALASRTGRFGAKSAMVADVVSIGDSWLANAIAEKLIEPIQGAEEQEWFQNLSSKWKVFLRRNEKGMIDESGKIWAVPYRWGCMVIAYKKNKFRKYNIAPIKDWDDLWRAELRGKVVMVDSPREVVGAVLKSMGSSYNIRDIDDDIPGGIDAVKQRLDELQKQVRLFDSSSYLKAFATADAWVAVGWSSDILPIARRQTDVAVIAPESGTSLWADLWAIPATTRFPNEEKAGGRVRGPSPMVHQWLEFCLQAARAAPYQQGVIPGAFPLTFDGAVSVSSHKVNPGQPELDSNLVDGGPPPEILKKCEFLGPLAESSLAVHQSLVAGMVKSGRGWFGGILSLFPGRKARTG
ncbi:putrescine-binding periplasmic protein-like protein isoform X2 [Wolffia australiana]